MARRLPTDPVKRRLQVFKRLYQHHQHWHALIEDHGMGDVITTPEGEDIFLGDMLVGLDFLPKRQRQAFELICLQGFTETAARDILLPRSVSSTPVQQYADSGLVRMVDAYDAKQAGRWPPPPAPKPVRRSRKKKRSIMAALHPLLKRHLEAARKDIQVQIEGLQQALAQVEAMLTAEAPVPAAPEPAPPPPVTKPAPNPKPEGKPDLTAMAKELASTG